MKNRRREALRDLLDLDCEIGHANNHGAGLWDIERRLDRIIVALRPKDGIGPLLTDDQHQELLKRGVDLAERVKRTK